MGFHGIITICVTASKVNRKLACLPVAYLISIEYCEEFDSVQKRLVYTNKRSVTSMWLAKYKSTWDLSFTSSGT